MSDVQTDTEFDLDAAQQQYDQARQGAAPGDGDGAGGPAGKEGKQAAGEDTPPNKEPNPHGHMSYQEWIDAGKDPDDYVGRNAYQQQHDRIVDNRRLEKEVKGLKKTQQQTLEAIGDWQAQEQARIRAELEADLDKAKEDEDVGAALEAQQALDEHDRKAKQPPATEASEEQEPIANFRAANPAIDPQSDDFNQEFNAEVELNYNAMLRRAIEQKREVTDSMINRWLKKAYKDAVETFGDDAPGQPAAKEDDEPPPVSDRNNRQGQQQTSKRRQAGKPADPKAENFVIENPRNPRQGHAASEIRDLIKDKYGDDDAKAFEQSLSR